MAAPAKFYLLCDGGYTFWLPGHIPSPQESTNPATIVVADPSTSSHLQTPQSGIRLYLIHGEVCDSFLYTNVCSKPMGTCNKQHLTPHQLASAINEFKAKAAADSKHINVMRYAPGQHPPTVLATVGAPPAAGAGYQHAAPPLPAAPYGHPQPAGYGVAPVPVAAPPVAAYGGAHPGGVAGGASMFGGPTGHPAPHHQMMPAMNASGIPSRPSGPNGSTFVSVQESRRNEDPLPANILAKYKGITKETHEKFINQRSVTYITSLKNTGGIVWLREFTPMPQHYKMLVQCSTRYTQVKITQVIHMPMPDVEGAKPVMLSDQKACTYYLSKGYCSRTDCIHVHRTPEQIKFLVAGKHQELKAMSSEERKAQQDHLIAAERSGDGTPVAGFNYGAVRPPSSTTPSASFPYQSGNGASSPTSNGEKTKKEDGDASSSSSDSSSDSSSSSSSDSDSSDSDDDDAKRGKRGRE